MAANDDVPTGGIRLSVDLSVDVEEMTRWRPGTIRAFFAGIAQVAEAREVGRNESSQSEAAHAD